MKQQYEIDIPRFLAYCKHRKGKDKLLKWWAWKRDVKSQSKKCTENPPAVTSSCDILVLHASEELAVLGRKNFLLESLRSEGVKIEEVIYKTVPEVVKENLVCGPYKYDSLFKIYEGHSNYLRKKYNPKIFLTERNGTLIAPFLKSRFEGDSVSFHLPHCVLNDQTRNHSMMDYDYFPLYGPSSLNYLKTLSNGFGSGRFYFAGSYLFNESFSLPEPDSSLPILFLGIGPQFEEKKRGIKINQMVADWQKKTGAELLIRLHQRGNGTFWKELKQPGVTILPVEDFVSSARRCSMMLSPYTNAVVDACLLNRPCQLVAAPDEVDYLEVERFFGKRASNADEIQSSIEKHQANFKDSVNKCKDLSDYHLSHGNKSVSYLKSLIMSILNGNPFEPACERKYDGSFIERSSESVECL